MNRKVAVEKNLAPFSSYLQREGYLVESMSVEDMLRTKLPDYDAYVVSGMSENFLGIQDTVTKAPVINADGLTPEEVAWMIGKV